MCKLFLDILKNPTKTIKKEKNRKNEKEIASMLIVEAILLAISFVPLVRTSLTSYTEISAFVITLAVILIVGILIESYILNLVFKVFSDKGKFFLSLKSIVLALYPISVGTLISVYLINFLTSLYLISAIIETILVAFGLSLFFRSLKEFYNESYIVIYIITILISMAILAGMYTIIFTRISSIPSTPFLF
ncbi:MAG: hypothetical protein B6U78_00610 [Candidatus Aenigmarchaeota archaeon ex4484_224]|nr:MAG: hypothetical protein B6U78_00610 [Candidatus Aenigmarchaeota archaeon ex4484_224]